jgi:predicted O-methyltransferase YrrM
MWRTISRLRNRLREFAFPITCGLRAVRIDDLLPPGVDLSIRLANWDQDAGAGSFWDLTTLAAIVRSYAPHVCVEIGTGLGRGTAQIAVNSPDDAVVYTFDIFDSPRVGSVFATLPESRKIRRVLADSTRYDFSALQGKVDFVLVDGCHDYVAVRSDTKLAFRLLSAKGVVLWHDLHPNWPGVVRALRESPNKMLIRRVSGSNYAWYSARGWGTR